MAIYKNKKYNSLFLDRDGVINIEKIGDYIYNRRQFVFCDGALEAFELFNQLFKHIIVVTNQRGVGRGLVSAEDVEDIHAYMRQQIENSNGRIDAIYYSPDLDSNSPTRKPNTGMALQAAAEWKDIDFKQSIMVGNTQSDMQFGKNLGMYNVFIRSGRPDANEADPLIDAHYNRLLDFALDLRADKF